jgi:hypothetical protein
MRNRKAVFILPAALLAVCAAYSPGFSDAPPPTVDQINALGAMFEDPAVSGNQNSGQLPPILAANKDGFMPATDSDEGGEISSYVDASAAQNGADQSSQDSAPRSSGKAAGAAAMKPQNSPKPQPVKAAGKVDFSHSFNTWSENYNNPSNPINSINNPSAVFPK